GLATVLVSMPPVAGAWAAGGAGIGLSLIALVVTVAAVWAAGRYIKRPWRMPAMLVAGVIGYFVIRATFDSAVDAIERFNPAQTGYLGGLGLPILLSWVVGGLLAAAAAWLVGRV